jgi:hypothetical protein
VHQQLITKGVIKDSLVVHRDMNQEAVGELPTAQPSMKGLMAEYSADAIQAEEARVLGQGQCWTIQCQDRQFSLF